MALLWCPKTNGTTAAPTGLPLHGDGIGARMTAAAVVVMQGVVADDELHLKPGQLGVVNREAARSGGAIMMWQVRAHAATLAHRGCKGAVCGKAQLALRIAQKMAGVGGECRAHADMHRFGRNGQRSQQGCFLHSLHGFLSGQKFYKYIPNPLPLNTGGGPQC